LAAFSLIACGELDWWRVLCFGLLYSAVNTWTCALNWGGNLEVLRKTTHISVNKDVISTAEIRTRRLSNTHQKHCHLSPLTRYIWLDELPLAAQKGLSCVQFLIPAWYTLPVGTAQEILSTVSYLRSFLQQPSYLGMKPKLGIFIRVKEGAKICLHRH